MANFFTKIFGTHSSHELKKIYPIADKVEALEEQFRKLSDEELRAKTDEFKKRYQDGETLDQLLPEAFATCREASWRVLGMRHYRVQIIGGIVLHQGRIAEMKTGEGKTLVATLPAYLNALTGKGVHIVTVNDYLAKRDSEWMGKVYRFLGLTVGLVIHEVPPQAAQGDVRCGHHLRHEQRVRLRLPARQHGDLQAGDGAARPRVRHRRRGRLHPDRRGAHAADHLRSGREVLADVRDRGPLRRRPQVPACQGG